MHICKYLDIPVCHANANRREVCTFICDATQSPSFEEFREKYGSKICLVIQEIIRIHREFPNDKILVFGQWHDLLRQMKAAMPRELKHCFLDGPLSQRCEIIEQFRTDPNLRVMLLSSESQSSGMPQQWYINICLPTCKCRYSYYTIQSSLVLYTELNGCIPVEHVQYGATIMMHCMW